MLDYFVENYMDSPRLEEIPEGQCETVRFCRVERYSSTQDKHVILRGISGSFRLKELPEMYLPYLLAGELTHIGKNTSFGFGRYTAASEPAESPRKRR